jgi:hypothetical protein
MAVFGDPYPIDMRFLTDDESLRDFARRYWGAVTVRGTAPHFKQTVAEILKHFGWKHTDVKNKLAAAAEVTCGKCKECGKQIVVQNRSDLNLKASNPVCRTCLQNYVEKMKQEREAYYARCREQEEMRRRQASTAPPVPSPSVPLPRPMTTAEMRQAHLDKRFGSSLHPVNLRDISLDDAVYLVAIFKASGCKQPNFILPLAGTMKNGFPNPATPGSHFTLEIIVHLFKSGIIGISHQSSLEAFEWNEDNTIKTYFSDLVIWRIAQSLSGNHLIEDIRATWRDPHLPSHWWSGVMRLWLLISKHECIEYLKHELKKYKLPVNLPNRAFKIIEEGLFVFGPPKLFNLIWRSGKDAAAKLREKQESMSIEQAADYCLDRLEYLIERYRHETDEVLAFGRTFARSVISEVLFDTVLKIGEAGFEGVPREYDDLGRRTG